MKKFRVTVNGTSYDVEVETLEEGVSSSPAPKVKSAPKPTPKPKAQPKPAPKKKAPKKESTPVAGGSAVEAPMPGTILNVNVSEGDSIASGDVLLILEAMKMENEIKSEVSGTVKTVNINEGDAVETGEALIVIG